MIYIGFIMNVGIFVGRFQPLHIGHLSIISHMQKKYDHVIIMVGSANQRKSFKNPFSFELRKQWIEHNFSSIKQDTQLLSVLPLNDFRYAEHKWEKALIDGVDFVTNPHDDIALVGYEKDDSSYYLSSFPNWSFDEVPLKINIDATTIRKDWYASKLTALANTSQFLPKDVLSYLINHQPYFDLLLKEHEFQQADQKRFEDYPYPETLKLCTSDAVAICDDKILLIKRGNVPGKGCWALPGGYVNANETFLQGGLRELFEETQIQLPKGFCLNDAVVGEKLFDDPKRCFGITRVTVGFLIKLPLIDGKLPGVKAADDAVEAKWVSYGDIKNLKMFDDHNDIIDHFLDIL